MGTNVKSSFQGAKLVIINFEKLKKPIKYVFYRCSAAQQDPDPLFITKKTKIRHKNTNLKAFIKKTQPLN